MINACTILARNYLAHGRVLLDSFLACHAEGTFTTLIIDAHESDTPPGDDRVRWLRLPDLGLDRAEQHRLAAIYDVTELSTAVKPILLRRLLDDGFADVVYLDPDIAIYAGLDDVSALARQHGIVLTPHTTEPFPDDGRGVDARFILAAGIYNLGFIAVSGAARPFLEWWWRSTRRDAISDVARMMFTDQRVIDFAPALFDPFLLKDPGYNVAYWNLHARAIAADAHRHRVNGVPLRFFHFSGFDVERPWLLSRNQGPRPRILLSERADVRALCDEYGQRVRAARGTDAVLAYRWSATASGLLLTTRMRRLYREAVIAAERTGAAWPPDPFAPDESDGFLTWLNEPGPGGPASVSRYLHSIYQDRADLQVHFRDLHGADAARFVDWLWHGGIAPERIPPELLTVGPVAGTCASPAAGASGVAILSDPSDDQAVSSANALGDALAVAGLQQGAVAAADVVICCGTPPRARDLAAGLRQRHAGHSVVGYWLADEDRLPQDLEVALDPFDEIWVDGEVLAESIRAVSTKLVFALAVPPSPNVRPGGGAGERAAGDHIRFVQIVDGRDDHERAAVAATMSAFARAFAPGEGPRLTFLVSGTGSSLLQLERLRAMASGRPDVHAIEAAGVDLTRYDVYISLARSREDARRIAGAMEQGLPAIAPAGVPPVTDATGYPIEVSGDASDDDVDRLASIMRAIHLHPGGVAARGVLAREAVNAPPPDGSASDRVARRVRAIRDERSRRATLPAIIMPKEAPLSRHTPRPANEPGGGSIESMLPRLESLATPHAEDGGAGLRGAAQRLLFRVLRPYWFQQYQLHRNMIEAFGRVARATRQEAEQREALERRVRELTHDVAEAAREIRRLDERSASSRQRQAADADSASNPQHQS